MQAVDPLFLRFVDAKSKFTAGTSDAATTRLAQRLAATPYNVGDILLKDEGLSLAQGVVDTLQLALTYSLNQLDVEQAAAQRSRQQASQAYAERAELFEQLVQQRELTAHLRQKLHKADRERHSVETMACRECGKAYTSHHALQSHIFKRHVHALPSLPLQPRPLGTSGFRQMARRPTLRGCSAGQHQRRHRHSQNRRPRSFDRR
jgi:hypothetical protein